MATDPAALWPYVLRQQQQQQPQPPPPNGESPLPIDVLLRRFESAALLGGGAAAVPQQQPPLPPFATGKEETQWSSTTTTTITGAEVHPDESLDSGAGACCCVEPSRSGGDPYRSSLLSLAPRHSTDQLVSGAASAQSFASEIGFADLAGWGASDDSLHGMEFELAAAVARYSNAGSRMLAEDAAADFAAVSSTQQDYAAVSLLNHITSMLHTQSRLSTSTAATEAGKEDEEKAAAAVAAANGKASADSSQLVLRALSNATFVSPANLRRFLPSGAAATAAAAASSESSLAPGHDSTPPLPIHCAALSASCLEAAGDANAGLRCVPPLSAASKYFEFLQELPQELFTQIARMMARFRRTQRAEVSGESIIVSVNLCGCSSPHASASPTGVHFHVGCERQPETLLSVMLVELHPDLPVVEFLDRRLPAVVRQHVGNRLDRNFVLQHRGLSLYRATLFQSSHVCWKVADLPACAPADLAHLQRHPLYRHLLVDLEQRPVKPRLSNLTLCPIQYKPHRPLPASAAHGRHSHPPAAAPSSNAASATTRWNGIANGISCARR